jgi:hypothetical protein
LDISKFSDRRLMQCSIHNWFIVSLTNGSSSKRVWWPIPGFLIHGLGKIQKLRVCTERKERGEERRERRERREWRGGKNRYTHSYSGDAELGL